MKSEPDIYRKISDMLKDSVNNSNETPEKYREFGIALKRVVDKNGASVYKDAKTLESALKAEKCETVLINRLILFISSSNIASYIPQVKTGISLTDVNNILMCAEENSGLNKLTIKELTVAVLYSLSLPTSLQATYIPVVSGVKVKDTAFESSAEYRSDLNIISEAVSQRNLEVLVPLFPILNRMADNGYADAQFQKGLCYLNGVGVEENGAEALRYFEMAAKNGCLNAYGALGDYYFDSFIPDYTKAFEYYTMLGATANSYDRQKRVKIILAEKTLNMKTVAADLLLTAALIVFNAFIMQGTFSVYGEVNLFWPIASIVLSVLAFSLSIVCFVKFRYNSVKWVTPLIFASAMICVFFAVI